MTNRIITFILLCVLSFMQQYLYAVNLLDYQENIEVEYQYDLKLPYNNDCREYTTTIIKYKSTEKTLQVLFFHKISTLTQSCDSTYGGIVEHSIYEMDTLFPEYEKTSRIFPEEFIKTVYPGKTITMVILHPKELKYTTVLEKIRVFNFGTKQYNESGEESDVQCNPCQMHINGEIYFGIKSDVVLIPIIN